MFLPIKPLQPSQMFVSKARSLPWSGVLKDVLPANFRLGWRGLTGTNTLAYSEHSQITNV
jgi:hypothetical protein